MDEELLLEIFNDEPNVPGRMVQGPGDGMSDSVPAVVLEETGEQQPAALGTGEFVIPAWAVSALGNGDTNAGAGQLNSLLNLLKEQYSENIKQEDTIPFNLEDV